MGLLQRTHKADPRRMPREKFPLPECGDGVYVYVRAMTAREVKAWIADSTDEKPASDFTLLSLCLVDDQGEPIYHDETDADGKVSKLAADVCRENLDVGAASQMSLVEKILDLTGISKRARESREKN